jgi:uncharacterized protein (DUF1810 family)
MTLMVDQIEADPAMNDPHDLNRFLSVQSPVVEQVRAELRAAAQNREFRRLSIAEP